MFAEHMNRAAGLPEDANTAAFLAVLAAALLIEPRRGRRSDAAVLAAAGGVVLCTLSRGGLLLLALLLLAVAMLPLLRGEGVLHRRTVKVAAAGAALLLLAAIGVLLLASFDLGMFGRATTQQRLELIAGGSFVRPQEMRAGFLEQYFELVADAPILGHGTGYSYSLPQGPHNRYLFQWVNFGLLGLGVFLWWLVATYRMFRARGCDAGLLVMLLVAAYSLLNHGVLELRGLALALGLLAGLSAPALKLQR
jgi:O-antigen ligase